MSWRSVLISHPAKLSLSQGQLVLQQTEKVTLPLEDIAIIVLEHPQIILTHQLLSACATQNVSLISTDPSFLPNGIFLPFQPHSRALKQLKRQLNLSKVRQKQIWQEIIQQKILNQSQVLLQQNLQPQANQLQKLAQKVKSGDKTHIEAYAAQIYFKALFGKPFKRRSDDLINAQLNFGYSIIRSAIARQLVAYGFIPALGIGHHNELNAFNLADDLIEPYRPIVDAQVVLLNTQAEENTLSTADKAQLISLLHQDTPRVQKGEFQGKSTLLALIEASVISLGQAMENSIPLTLPSLVENHHEQRE